MQITEKNFLNKKLRKKLSKRIGIYGEDYGMSKETVENAVSQLDIKDEYFSNLLATPHFSNSEIDCIIDINV